MAWVPRGKRPPLLGGLLDLELQCVPQVYPTFEDLGEIIAIHENDVAAPAAKRVDDFRAYALNGNKQPPRAFELTSTFPSNPLISAAEG